MTTDSVIKEEQFCEKELIVKNISGLHVRPASIIARLLQDAESEITFTYKSETVNAKSVLSILMLGATKDSRIHVLVKGKDSLIVMDKLSKIFEEKFGES